MNDKEFADAIHMEIHAVRRINNYKANPMEINISKLVIDKFKNSCNECREVSKKIKQEPEKKGFLDNLKGVLE